MHLSQCIYFLKETIDLCINRFETTYLHSNHVPAPLRFMIRDYVYEPLIDATIHTAVSHWCKGISEVKPNSTITADSNKEAKARFSIEYSCVMDSFHIGM